VLPGGVDVVPTLEQYRELRYTMRCINESMRLYPHPPVLLRRALRDDTLPNGLSVPKDQDVMIAVYNIHRCAPATCMTAACNIHRCARATRLTAACNIHRCAPATTSSHDHCLKHPPSHACHNRRQVTTRFPRRMSTTACLSST
jgi:Cytochrome P450